MPAMPKNNGSDDESYHAEEQSEDDYDLPVLEFSDDEDEPILPNPIRVGGTTPENRPVIPPIAPAVAQEDRMVVDLEPDDERERERLLPPRAKRSRILRSVSVEERRREDDEAVIISIILFLFIIFRPLTILHLTRNSATFHRVTRTRTYPIVILSSSRNGILSNVFYVKT